MTSVTVTKIADERLLRVRCPDELRNLPGWLMWKYEPAMGGGKPRKVPYYAAGGRRTGRNGSADDRNKLTNFDSALSAATRQGMTGVGLAMLADWGITALDFDDAVTGGVVLPEVKALVSGTYAEFSPSGKGVRAFVLGAAGDAKTFDPPCGFETFCTAGYVTFTGMALPGAASTVAPMSGSLRDYIARRLQKGREPEAKPQQIGEPVGLTAEQIRELLAVVDPDENYQRWVSTGLAIHHETEGEGFDLWDDWSAPGPKYPGREELQRRWDGFGRHGRRGVTIRSLMKLAGDRGAKVPSAVSTTNDFDAVADTPEEGAAKKAKLARFAVVPAHEMANEPPPGWLVKHVIPQAELAMLYGPSGSGKSFVMLDLGMAIARGVPWRGHKVRQGRVVYICAEGRGGFRNRLKAYALRHEVDLAQVPFGVIRTAPNFLLADDVKAVHEAIQGAQGASMVIVDTFAQVTAGANENSGEDMGLALRHARMIAEATRAVVVIIHHSGKDLARGARGWSGLKAAADAEFEVVRDEATGKRWVEVTKQKDGNDQGRWGFRLDDVVVDFDEDGEAITSCVIAAEDGEAITSCVIAAEDPPQAGRWQKIEEDRIDALFLELLESFAAQGRNVNEATGKAYAPARFAEDPRAKGVKSAGFASAMSRLFAAGQIRLETFGSRSKSRTRIVRGGGAQT
jgi:hypothetical protein